MLAKLKRPHEVFLDKVDDILTLNFADLAGKQMQHTDSFFYKGFFCDLLPCYFDFLPCQYLDLDPEKQIRGALQAQEKTSKVSLSEGRVIFMKEQSSFLCAPTGTAAEVLEPFCTRPMFFQWKVLHHGAVCGLGLLSSEEEFQGDLLRGFRLALHKVHHFKLLQKAWYRLCGPEEAKESASVCPLCYWIRQIQATICLQRIAGLTLTSLQSMQAALWRGCDALNLVFPTRWWNSSDRSQIFGCDYPLCLARAPSSLGERGGICNLRSPFQFCNVQCVHAVI
ncbi:unnamed protein product [Cladocopium goreaui]|uniref:Uncharacterized protein n=1 Tax=Cladocopium goreaui TaxID=2562237 RepID=A0A9P1CRJ3_9DINO|nr:unnamed protein product [Cladocopium goreaui]